MRKTLIITFLLSFTGLYAQYLKPYFNTISIEKGLPEGYVVSSLQDKLGYMWLGTQNGIVRFNGYELKPYSFADEDGLPIIHAGIMQLHEDQNDKLWVIVNNHGLYSLDRQKEQFIKMPLDSAGRNAFRDHYFVSWVEDTENETHWFFALNISTLVPSVFAWNETRNRFKKYPSSAEIGDFMPGIRNQYLIQDAHGKIWLADGRVLSYFDASSNAFEPWFKIPADQKNRMISGIADDPSNSDKLWVSTFKPGEARSANPGDLEIYHVNTKTKTHQSFKHVKNDPNTIAGNCNHIINDSRDRTWFSTDQGISLFHPESGTFSNYRVPLPASYAGSESAISEVAADQEGNLWMAGNFNGLLYLDVKTSKHSLHVHTKAPGSLPDSPRGTNKLFYDRSGTLWVSLPWRGISYLNLQKSMLNPIPIKPPSGGANGYIGGDDFYISGKYNDSIFFVNNSSGLFEWNYKQNIFKRIELNNDDIYGQITFTYVTKDGLIWVGSTGAGLVSHDPEKKSAITFSNDPNDSTSISSNSITYLDEDGEGNLWIGTGDQGLCFFNRKESTFTRFPFITNNGTIKADNVLDDDRVLSIHVDKDEIAWIGTNNGALNRFDPGSLKFNSYLDDKSGFYCVVNIFEDSKQRIWNGTYLSGLFLFNKETGITKRYSTQEGLLHNSVFGTIEDHSGNIWFTSLRGLSRLNPESDLITNFQIPIGNVRYTKTIFTDSEGWLQVAIENGLISFDPEKLIATPVSPVTVIESVSYRNYLNKDTIVFTGGKSQLELRHDENKITFEYVGLDYANAELNQYVYLLEGYDTEWIQAGTQRSATYTNLSPGKYTFQVKAANSGGTWDETGSSFSIRISSPWWQTTAAYVVYGLLIVAGIVLADRIQRRRLKEKAMAKARERELEQAREIEKAYHELKETQKQLIHSEKMASLGELTAGIAHEIQNPLNFVNNFSEINLELIEEANDEMHRGDPSQVKALLNDLKENEVKIHHHGKRADRIVKGMLAHSRSSNGHKEPTDINALADEYLRLAYHGLRAKDSSFNADFRLEADEKLPKIPVVPQDIGRVLLNLINNAFQAVSDKSLSGTDNFKPQVLVTTNYLGNALEIRVKDNGPGIPEDIQEKIFQPFFTTKPTGEGTGLGLSLSYDIIKAHRGEVTVASAEGEGTEFMIILPTN